MSKRARALVFGAMLAAMNLAGMTAIAQAQTTDGPVSKQDARRPQVSESYRNYHEAMAARAQAAQDDAVQQFRRGERASQEQPTIADDARRPPAETQVGESWRHPGNVRLRPAEPSGQPVSLVAWLSVLAAVLALAGGLAVLAVRRAGRKVQAGQPA